MNTIRRERLRPRVNSVNFRSFKWLLLREAVFTLLAPNYEEWGSARVSRRWLAERNTDQVKDLGAALLRRFPERRIRR